MKKSLLFVLFALVSIVSYSQISWNVKAGMNMSNLTAVEESSMKLGYYVGVGMEYQLDEMWSIQPSLLFTTKGAKQEFKFEGEEDKTTFNPMYIELPIMAAARFAIADDMNIVVNAGPYLAFGVGGKIKNEFTDEGKSFTYKSDIFDDEFDTDGTLEREAYKRFDFGLGVGVTLEISKFFVGLNGEFGLTKLADVYKYDWNSDKLIDKKSARNMNFSVGVGYKF